MLNSGIVAGVFCVALDIISIVEGNNDVNAEDIDVTTDDVDTSTSDVDTDEIDDCCC